MYQSPLSISNRTTRENKKRVKKYISDHSSHKCNLLKRRVLLDKFYDSNVKREDASIRFSCFLVGVNIFRKSKNVTKIYKNKSLCFEFQGLTKDKKLVMVHVREDKTNKGKQLFLISTFYKK